MEVYTYASHSEAGTLLGSNSMRNRIARIDKYEQESLIGGAPAFSYLEILSKPRKTRK